MKEGLNFVLIFIYRFKIKDLKIIVISYFTFPKVQKGRHMWEEPKEARVSK